MTLEVTFNLKPNQEPWYNATGTPGELAAHIAEVFPESKPFFDKRDLAGLYLAANNEFKNRYAAATQHFAVQNAAPLTQPAPQQAPADPWGSVPPPPEPASDPWGQPAQAPQQYQAPAPQNFGQAAAAPGATPHMIGEVSGMPMKLITGKEYKSGRNAGQKYDALVDPRDLPQGYTGPKDQMLFSTNGYKRK